MSSFFGFDTSRHNAAATGFSQPHDPFAGLADRDNSGDALEFEDTYDGLVDKLDETNDAFNDDTFGGGLSSGNVAKDFDFFGQTAKVADAIAEEHVLFNRQQPAPKTTAQTVPRDAYNYPHDPYQHSPQRPVRTGYEQYKDESVEELQVDAALWGVAPKKQTTSGASALHAQTASPPSRKIMSLEEVEAQMRAQTKQSTQPAAPSQTHQTQPVGHAPMGFDGGSSKFPSAEPDTAFASWGEPAQDSPHGHGNPMTILQRPQAKATPPVQATAPLQVPMQQHRQQPSVTIQPTQILQNPNRHSAGINSRMGMATHHSAAAQPTPPPQPIRTASAGPRQQASFTNQPAQYVAHPSQVPQMSEEEKAAYLEQEAKSAKRNYKIFMMSKDNGLMTPQDKNFITRIQLQQLVSATGNPNEHGTHESMAEDFYYQVTNQIRSGQRMNPHQPLSNFAQTYLYQTGNRQGGARRHNRGPENHMQRMEQQVQRAVEAAKNKPKNKQLVIEGSLGKISFSNAKTPKPLLNIKRAENAGETQRPGSAHKTSHAPGGRDQKSELRSIEAIYSILMKVEDNERSIPTSPLTEHSSPECVQKWHAWREEGVRLNERLWAALRVHDDPENSLDMHPFIALLTYSKGKKAMPRVFRHTSVEQRTTILTRIIVSLDTFDVVRNAQVDTADTHLNSAMREDIENFSSSVMSTLFIFMNELELDIIAGILAILCSRNVDLIAKSRVGASMLTMILSRAEIIKASNGGNEQSLRSWDVYFNQLFDMIEHTLPHVFPPTLNTADDVYVWQLLAALGIHASPEQQQRLVIAVKDRVMDTVALAKTLPAEMSRQRLANVNLFMRSIGLDVELLQ